MNKKVVVAIVTGAVLVAVATSVWLFVSGRVAFVVKAPLDRVVVTPRVCGDDVIATYNSVLESKDLVQYNERLKAADDAVARLQNAEKDPNCMYIRYAYSIRNGQYDKAQQYVTALKNLAGSHTYATAELSDTQSVSAMEARLKAAQAANKDGTTLPNPAVIPRSGDGRG